MGIECGQGGLRIDRGPLQRCAFWDKAEGAGCGEDASGALDAVFFTSSAGGFTSHDYWTRMHKEETRTRACIRKI